METAPTPSLIYVLESWPVPVYGGPLKAEGDVLRGLDGPWSAHIALPVSFFGGPGGAPMQEELRIDLDFQRPLSEAPPGTLRVHVRGLSGYVHSHTLDASVFEDELIAESHDGSAFLRLSFQGGVPHGEMSLVSMGRRFTFELPHLVRLSE